MNHYQRTGRALQLEGLENARNKVTLGFKCDAGIKIQLVREAHQEEMTLSEYVETLVASRHQRDTEGVNFQLGYSHNEQRQMEELKQKLDFYEENPILEHFFEQYEGRILYYPDLQGRKQSIQIRQIADIFTVLIHSFTPQQQ